MLASSWDTLIERYTRRAFAKSFRVLATALLVLCGALLIASRLRIQGDFVELLPTSSAPAQRFREALARKGGGDSTLVVLVQSSDREKNRAFIDHLQKRLESLPVGLASGIDAGPRAIRAYFERFRWLFLSSTELARAECELELAREKQSPGYIDLGEDCSDARPSPQEKGSAPAGAFSGEGGLKRVRAEIEARVKAADRFPDGYYRSEDGAVFALVVKARRAGMGEVASDQLLKRTSDAAAEVAGELGGGLDVGFGGDIPTAIAEREALLDDIGIVSAAAVLLVFGSIIWFFRSLAALLYIGSAVTLGTSLAFAVAALAFGRLNAATSFLGSIIVGNGINYAIIYLSRYVEQRRAGVPREAALVDAALSSRRATWLAALAASLSYASLLATSFRGFSEFGLIGGVGMVLCWLATFAVLPACIGAFDGRWGKGLGEDARAPRTARGVSLPARLTRLATERPRATLLVSVALAAATLWPIARYLRDPWEYDFSRLRSESSAKSGASHYSSLADRVFGTRGAPVLVLADDISDAPRLAERAWLVDRELTSGKFIEKVETIYDRLGGEPEVVRDKLQALARIRAHVDVLLRHAARDDRDELNELRPPDDLRAPLISDLPPALLQQFTESNGRVGTPVYISLNRKISQSRGQNLLQISEILKKLTRHDGTPLPNAGRATVFAEMIRSMEQDGPRATLLAFLAVVLVSALLTRRLKALSLVVGSLLLGVTLMLGFAALGNLRLNFLNFVALPLTFGIGVEYAINVYERTRIEGSVARAGESVGGAVALCSLTTVLGYGALMFADNRALQSFGRYAIVGEIVCLASALLALPAALSLLEKRPRRRAKAPSAGRLSADALS
jgi:predicted RND superfamily exporter protein